MNISMINGYKYNPSGVPSFLRYSTFSFDFLKSSLVTFILRSRRAIRPASVQIAYRKYEHQNTNYLTNVLKTCVYYIAQCDKCI